MQAGLLFTMDYFIRACMLPEDLIIALIYRATDGNWNSWGILKHASSPCACMYAGETIDTVSRSDSCVSTVIFLRRTGALPYSATLTLICKSHVDHPNPPHNVKAQMH